jgi:hypothetical protein
MLKNKHYANYEESNDKKQDSKQLGFQKLGTA